MLLKNTLHVSISCIPSDDRTVLTVHCYSGCKFFLTKKDKWNIFYTYHFLASTIGICTVVYVKSVDQIFMLNLILNLS